MELRQRPAERAAVARMHAGAARLPSRKLTSAAGRPQSERSAWPSRPWIGVGQATPLAARWSISARKNGRSSRRHPLLVERQDEAAVLGHQPVVGVLDALAGCLRARPAAAGRRPRGRPRARPGRSRCRPPSASAGASGRRVRPARAAHDACRIGIGGVLNETSSWTTRTSCTSIAKRSRQAAISSSTSALGRRGAGADRDRRDAVEQRPVHARGALHERRRRAAGGLGDLDQADRVGRVGRADDQRQVGLAARSPRPRAGGWSWRSRCPRAAARRSPGSAA